MPKGKVLNIVYCLPISFNKFDVYSYKVPRLTSKLLSFQDLTAVKALVPAVTQATQVDTRVAMLVSLVVTPPPLLPTNTVLLPDLPISVEEPPTLVALLPANT